MICKILEKIPEKHLLKMAHVNRSFNKLALSLIRSSESYFWRKNTRDDPNGSRSLLLKFTSLQVLNMDYAQPMFDSMSSEQVDHFSRQLAHSCPKISTIYLSDVICFKIVHKYLLQLERSKVHNRLKKLIAFIDSDGEQVEKEYLLEQIVKLSPQIQTLDVTRCHTGSNNGSITSSSTVSSRRSSNCSIQSCNEDSPNALCITCQSMIEDKSDDMRYEIENEAILHSLLAQETHCI